MTLQTTYLSSDLWVLRNYSPKMEKAAQQICIFRRTETRSVLDRRGLVAEVTVRVRVRIRGRGRGRPPKP